MNKGMLTAGLYARVSSDRQKDEKTIESQLYDLEERLQADECVVEEEFRFIDDGYSGETLRRPALEHLRDLAYAGGLDRLYVHSPDRLARKYAYQVLLVEEFIRAGVEVVFLNYAVDDTPEGNLLLQMQGMIAEYERAKILERSRRGKRHAARRGSVSALTRAPYGYRYVRKSEGDGDAAWHIVLEQAKVVRELFEWVAYEGLSIREAAARLTKQGIPTFSGQEIWNPGTVAGMLRNSAYCGRAMFGKTRVGERRARLRPVRGRSATPRRDRSIYRTSPEDQECIGVPAIIGEALFEAVQEKLAENKRRYRGRWTGGNYLLRGLTVCAQCGYAYVGARNKGNRYYRCASDAARVGKERLCWNRTIRADGLEQSVWEDVCWLLRDPQRVEEEYARRLDRSQETDPTLEQTEKLIQQKKLALSRLLDLYENGLLDKELFLMRFQNVKDRLSKLELEAARCREAASQEAELRLAMDHLEEFASRIEAGLETADFSTRRKILQALVKQVDVGGEEIRIVYKVSPRPFEKAPLGGSLQDCTRHRGTDV